MSSSCTLNARMCDLMTRAAAAEAAIIAYTTELTRLTRASSQATNALDSLHGHTARQCLCMDTATCIGQTCPTPPSPALAQLRATNASLCTELATITTELRLSQPPHALHASQEDSRSDDSDREDLDLHMAVCRIRRRGAVKRRIPRPPPGTVQTLTQLAAAQVRHALLNGTDPQRAWICSQLPPAIRKDVGWIAQVHLRHRRPSAYR